MSVFSRKVEFIIESSWMEGAQLEDPEVLSMQKKVSHLFVCEVFLCYFLYNHNPEVPVEAMSR